MAHDSGGRRVTAIFFRPGRADRADHAGSAGHTRSITKEAGADRRDADD
jgi:hypothetical protein